jgi:parvulin-like peptidyl-prolyl isomerase
MCGTGFSYIELMTRTFAIFLAAALTISAARGQSAADRADVLAVVGSTPITAQELRQRLELMPWRRQGKTAEHDSMKVHALQALVAERIFAFEAARLGRTEDPVTRRMREGLERVFLRDELYRQEVVERCAPTGEEMAAGLKRLSRQLTVLVVTAHSQADAASRSSQLNLSKNPDLLLAAWRTDVDTLTVNYGGLEPGFEDAAYGLKRGRASDPVRSPTLGWTVLWLLRSGPNPEYAKLNVDERSHRVEKTIRGRKEAVRGPEFYYGLLKDIKVTADSSLLLTAAREVLAIWKRDTAVARSKGMFVVGAGMIDEMIQRLDSVAARPYVVLPDGPLAFADVLEALRYLNAESKTLDPSEVALSLNAAMREAVADEVLAREARRRSLQYAPRVERDMKTWTTYWASRAQYYAVRDEATVTDDDVLRFLVRNAPVLGTYYAVNLEEVLTADVLTADSALARLLRGDRFADVARDMSVRSDWRDRGGVSGFFDASEHPELAFRAMMGPLHQLRGPVKLAEGYSVFRLLDVKRKQPGYIAPDSLAANARGRLLSEQRQRRVDAFLAEGARRYQVRFFYDRLKSVPVTDVPMFTRRTIGFGGTMIAAPLINPQWEWVKDLERPALP